MAKKTDYNYFDFFVDMAGRCAASLELLHKVFSDYKYAELERYRDEMREIEHNADLAKHEMTGHLMREFLPPIDREDIIQISYVLDNVCDSAEDVILRFYMNDVRQSRPDILPFIEVIDRQCGELCELFKRFQNFKKDTSISGHVVMINTQEEEVDRLYHDAMHRLMTDGSDLREVIVWREIYACLEDCADACEDVADAVDAVLMKNS